MAHPEQRQWCLYVKSLFPEFFIGKNVIDFGSLDINGSNKDLFVSCNYTGIDIGPGRNVDIICNAHEFTTDKVIDVVISTEMFEHDRHIDKSIKNMVSILRPGGLFLFTCATIGRNEHGTRRTSPADSPFTSIEDGHEDYYRNLSEKDVRDMLDVDGIFHNYLFDTIPRPEDLRFYGIKKI